MKNINCLVHDSHFLQLSDKLVNQMVNLPIGAQLSSFLLFLLAKAWNVLESGKYIWQESVENCCAAIQSWNFPLALAASGDGHSPCRIMLLSTSFGTNINTTILQRKPVVYLSILWSLKHSYAFYYQFNHMQLLISAEQIFESSFRNPVAMTNILCI